VWNEMENNKQSGLYTRQIKSIGNGHLYVD
jgi:hypothetical protein